MSDLACACAYPACTRPSADECRSLHTKTCAPRMRNSRSFVLRIEALPGEGIPETFRYLTCPASATFSDLHEAIQKAFKWRRLHFFDFKVRKSTSDSRGRDERTEEQASNIVEYGRLAVCNWQTQDLLRLVPYDPSQEPLDVNVKKFKRMYARQDGTPLGHLTDEMKKGNSYRWHDLTPTKNTKDVALRDVFGVKKYAGHWIEYEYDWVGGWVHRIVLERRGFPTDRFFALDGEGHAIAEDVYKATSLSGPLAWRELLHAATKSTKGRHALSAKQVFLLGWFKNKCPNGGCGCLPDGNCYLANWRNHVSLDAAEEGECYEEAAREVKPGKNKKRNQRKRNKDKSASREEQPIKKEIPGSQMLAALKPASSASTVPSAPTTPSADPQHQDEKADERPDGQSADIGGAVR